MDIYKVSESMRFQRSSVFPPSLVWPITLVITVLNFALWFLTYSGDAWKALPIAAAVVVAGSIGVAVELAQARAKDRQAIWDAYADREISRATQRERSSLRQVHTNPIAVDTRDCAINPPKGEKE